MNREEYIIARNENDGQDILSLSINDIELILEDQLDLYNDEEIAALKERLSALYTEESISREKEAKEGQRKLIPPVIKCPKCDGENPSSNHQCQYCSYIFKEKDYYVCSDAQDKRMKQPDGTDEANNRILYFIAFLIPVLGILIGLVYIAKNEDALGKSLIIFSIVGTIVIALIGLALSGTFSSILTDLSSKTCHNCGDVILGEAVEAGGRYYCSYDCYMEEFLFD